MIQTIKAADHDDWLTLRKRGIGSSEVGTILSVNPYDTPFQLWLRKTGQAPAIPENTAMRMGHLLEPIVAQLYAENTGNTIDPETEGDFVVINDRMPFMVASPDRYVTTPNGSKVLLECKTTAMQITEDTLPKSWFCQVQYLLACSELSEASIAWLVRGRDFGYMPIKRSDKFIDFMLGKIADFWECVKSGNAPQMNTANASDVEAMWKAEVSEKVQFANEEVYDTYKRLQEVKNEIAELTTKKDSYETTIKAFMADAERLEYGDTLLATWKTAKGRETFDSKAFKADYPDIYKQYVHKGESGRRFLLK